MIDQKVIEDVEDAFDKLQEVKTLLERLYYHPEFATFSTRPIISMLIDASKYLQDNLRVLVNKYLARG